MDNPDPNTFPFHPSDNNGNNDNNNGNETNDDHEDNHATNETLTPDRANRFADADDDSEPESAMWSARDPPD